MKQDKGKWVEDVLNSTTGIAPVSPRADLYDQIKAKLGRQLPKVKRIPLIALPAAAACLLVLFALNLRAVSKYVNTSSTTGEVSTETTVEDIVDYYDLGSNNVGL